MKTGTPPLRSSRPRKKQVGIRFDPGIPSEVRRLAPAGGVPQQTLIRL